jgi:peroxiredoxin Q/BCP
LESADSLPENRVFPSPLAAIRKGRRKYVAANCALYLFFSAALLLCLGVGFCIAYRACPAPAVGAAFVTRPASQHYTGTVHFDLLAKFMADDRRSQPTPNWLHEILSSPRLPTLSHPLLDRPAPAFTLADHLEQPQALDRLLERGPVVLVFYLGSTCHACMHELLELNADLERFHALGAEIVAASDDSSAQTRRRFKEFGALRFPVLADPDHAVARAYDAIRPGQTAEAETLRHATFLIARDGRVQWAYFGDAPFRNNQALLAELAQRSREED